MAKKKSKKKTQKKGSGKGWRGEPDRHREAFSRVRRKGNLQPRNIKQKTSHMS